MNPHFCYAKEESLMKNFKKLLVAFMFMLLVGSLTACSQMNKVTNYFEEQGYIRYAYNNRGDSALFTVHDSLALEEEVVTTTEASTEITTITTTSETTDAVTTTEKYTLRFISYIFSNGSDAVIVMEFESAAYLQELLATSPTLIAEFEGQDPADYVNGNCLLIVLDDYIDLYDHYVEIFQGRAEPLVTTEAPVTTTEAETETTTA